MGTPVVTCKCEVCSSSDPHNHRLRPAGLFKLGEERFLVDTGPDFRCQALKYGIDRLDGVLITHTHFDHIAGIETSGSIIFYRNRHFHAFFRTQSLDENQKDPWLFF